MWYYTVYFVVSSLVFLFLSLIWNRNDYLNLTLKGLFAFLLLWSVFFALLSWIHLHV